MRGEEERRGEGERRRGEVSNVGWGYQGHGRESYYIVFTSGERRGGEGKEREGVSNVGALTSC